MLYMWLKFIVYISWHREFGDGFFSESWHGDFGGGCFSE